MIAILVVGADEYPVSMIDRLRSIGRVDRLNNPSRGDLTSALADGAHEVLFTHLGVQLDAKLLRANRSLRWIVTPTTGLTHIDLDAAEALGIRVISLRDCAEDLVGVTATAELTWGLLLALVRYIPDASASVQHGRWERARFEGMQLSEKTIGIAGFGRLGSLVGRYANAFGMQVLATDSAREVITGAPKYVQFVDDDTLLRQADILSIHLPLNEETRRWLGAGRISLMRKGSWLVNTARGEIVDEHAVADALRSGQLAGVATDVLENDASWSGVVDPNPLLHAAQDGCRVLVTPHIGGVASEAIESTRTSIVVRFLNELRASPSESL